ncbi:histone-like transcription factor and archaeal histone protein [Rhizoctonia solani AG-3 Rhs1AP]|uniref:Histone-like transcription factor and archaeal histone protein n=2 Tax=Rhizoctonia solani AG-3 TaxID=1086053 RepID=A0A074S437_9AGAM|nr:histone-like transcription factor and archaeal histone protein [Rhizoctonia solani AG-3 Rhs1AP]KEP54029.1 histone-like transcription factor and archaeal histone protein [Rhizoctonia solani 123E]
MEVEPTHPELVSPVPAHPQQQPQPQPEVTPNEKQPKPKPAPPELGESVLPMARVQKIMRADKELPNVTKEAVHTISVATEEFIRRLSSAAYAQADRDKRSMIQYKDVALAVKRTPELHFLEEMIPTTIPAPQALAQHRLKLAERNNGPTAVSTPTNGSTARKPKPANGKNKPAAGPSTEGTATPDVTDEQNEMDLS